MINPTTPITATQSTRDRIMSKKKEAYYFSHDYNARNDEKIKDLVMEMGMEGYGIFWAIVEDLYNNANALQTNYKRMAYELRCDEEKVRKVVCDFNLFAISDEKFSSNSVKKRIREKERKSKQASISARKRWDANALPTQSDSNALKERKGKEINKKKGSRETTSFTPPSIEQVTLYFMENGYLESAAKKAFEYYNSSGWKDSKGNKVKNWKQKMISVWFRDEHKSKEEKHTISQATLEMLNGK